MFPLWNLSLPDMYVGFLDCLENSDFNIMGMLNIEYEPEYSNRIYEQIINVDSINQTFINDKNYNEKGILSTSII